MEIIRRLYKQSAFALIPLALASALYEWKKMPLSIILGGVMGVANLKGLAWGIKGLLRSARAAAGLVFFSFLRLFALTAVIAFLVLTGVADIIGILIGFTVVLALLLREGLRAVKEESEGKGA